MRGSCQFEKAFDDLIDELPVAQRLERLEAVPDISCVIGIAGFEPRCYAAAEAMCRLSWRAENGVCVTYANREMEGPNSQYANELHSRIASMSSEETTKVIQHDDHSLDAAFGGRIVDVLREMKVDRS